MSHLSRRAAWIATLLAVGASLAVAHAQSPAQDPALARTALDPELQWGPCPEFLPLGCQIAVLRGDLAQPNADVFFKVPGKAQIAAHHHTSAERMVLVSGEMEVKYEGQPPAKLQRGSYAYGPPKRVHSAVCTSSEPCVLFIAFEQAVDAIAASPCATGALEPARRGGAAAVVWLSGRDARSGWARPARWLVPQGLRNQWSSAGRAVCSSIRHGPCTGTLARWLCPSGSPPSSTTWRWWARAPSS